MTIRKLIPALLGAAFMSGLATPALAYDDDWDDRSRYQSQRWDDRIGGAWWQERLYRDPALRRIAFRQFDRNEDGRLGPRERARIERQFGDFADRNGDGFVSRREFDRARAQLIRRYDHERWR